MQEKKHVNLKIWQKRKDQSSKRARWHCENDRKPNLQALLNTHPLS